MRPHNIASHHVRGFTLIEIAVALFIIALLLGSLLVPLTTQVDQRKISDTQRSLDEIKEALTGFAISNHYLPCPAVSATNGQEDRDIAAGACTGGRRNGLIPWVTLGVSKLDSWGNIFRYSVTPAFASSTSLFTLSTATDITVRTRDSTGALVNLTNASSIPALVFSHGKNAYGAFNDPGVAQALPGDWPTNNMDESTNATDTTTFVSRVPQGVGASGAGGEFDDIVVWLSPNILFNRMVAAGKLP
jgi:prepilin-type N-terminal cleavage/methylation domain-containing protein